MTAQTPQKLSECKHLTAVIIFSTLNDPENILSHIGKIRNFQGELTDVAAVTKSQLGRDV